MGSNHDETGWLNEQDGHLILRRDEGGRWRLDVGFWHWWKARKLIGKRVRVQGVRGEFDLLEVQKLDAI